MNPFIFDPKRVATPVAAAYISSLYDQEIASSIAPARVLEDNVNAIADVLRQTNPDLAPSLDLLIENAKYLGHAEGSRQALDTMKTQFRSALPYAIKQAMAAPAAKS
jgi:hypothetical protein